MAAFDSAQQVRVHGRRLRVSNLDKVLYPKVGFRKADVLDYYVRIAPVLLPHLTGRPLTLKRYPDGVEGPFFYEKKCPAHRPSWVKTAAVQMDEKVIHFCLANDVATLVWAANLADLEMHTSLSLARSIWQPTMMVFDLDPGPPAHIVQCCQVALLLRELLDRMGLESFAKTSGSKGLQLYVPLNTKVAYEQTKSFARTLAEYLTRSHPGLVLANMKKSLRTGKVFVDWSQNDEKKTTVCVYSLRARERPTVSTPVFWSEVRRAAQGTSAEALVFTTQDTLARVARHGDLFAPVLTRKQKLPGQGR